MFDSLPDSIAAALGLMMTEPPTILRLDLEERGEVLESRPHAGKLVSLFMKWKNAVSAASSLPVRESGCMNIIIQVVRGSIPMKHSELNN